MKLYVEDRLQVRETIVPWCEENIGYNRSWQWFPSYMHKGKLAIMFRIHNDEDVVAFKLRWGDYIL